MGNLYNPDVRYTFNIPIEDKPQQFYWNAYGPWQPCSKLCQGGCLGRLGRRRSFVLDSSWDLGSAVKSLSVCFLWGSEVTGVIVALGCSGG